MKQESLNLKYIAWLLKNLYHSDLEIHDRGTSIVKPSKLFLNLCMTIQVQNHKGLDRNYKPTHTKRIEIFRYNTPLVFTDKVEDVDYHFSVITILCDLEEKWEYKEGKDVLTLTESNYRVEETSEQYSKGRKMIDSEVERWLNAIKPVIKDYLR